MLSKITKQIIGSILGCFAGAGVGFSMIIGIARIIGVNLDFSIIPLWLAYIMLWGGFITFVGVGLWLIIILFIGIYKLIRALCA